MSKNNSESKGTPKKEKKPKLGRKFYEKELYKLQVELCKLQNWVKHEQLRIIVVFEGRDAAGKGGIIKRITQRVSPRIFRVVALPAPTDREKTQMYLQRYLVHFPSGGEVVIFDRSWYNRAGVERVMKFCTDEQYRMFIQNVDEFEHWITESGIFLIKYWLTVENEEQERRFKARISDPTKHWKLSPMDVESRRRWYEYSRARDAMLDASDSRHSPWYLVDSNDKRRARLNCITHLLQQIPYEELPHDPPKLPKRNEEHAYDDVAALKGRNFIPEVY
ncbi:MAG: polyphosphate kinase 2 [Arenicellales bacterium]|nr:polyphosphate kinase 2 [Arenicellales bacterium]